MGFGISSWGVSCSVGFAPVIKERDFAGSECKMSTILDFWCRGLRRFVACLGMLRSFGVVQQFCFAVARLGGLGIWGFGKGLSWSWGFFVCLAIRGVNGFLSDSYC